jgi:hypothetical protein
MLPVSVYTRWFKYDRDYLCVNKSQFVPVIFEPPCIYTHTHTYIFPMIVFVVNNAKNFETTLLLHGINTRHKSQLHRPTANLTCTQKGVNCCSIRIFNSLPSNILKLQNDKSSFEVALRRYLTAHTFYFLDSFFSRSQDISNIILL